MFGAFAVAALTLSPVGNPVEAVAQPADSGNGTSWTVDGDYSALVACIHSNLRRVNGRYLLRAGPEAAVIAGLQDHLAAEEAVLGDAEWRVDAVRMSAKTIELRTQMLAPDEYSHTTFNILRDRIDRCSEP